QRPTACAAGITYADSSDVLAAATVRHCSAIVRPTTGSDSTHDGGAGIVTCVRAVAHSSTRGALRTSVVIAKNTGRATMSASALVITKTARPRRPPRPVSMRKRTGHVA